ncbi:MAG: aminotransferase class I/II-fold pyridoxal phosphate-dependent enzyme [Deferribacteraceae bacterium]|nr:aminotransferase class I/II-fold pyridoxal phosphate-dependent enzyme [Deferribacteraceae bacterium]
MNPLAIELNNAIQEQTPSVYKMLSQLGLEMFMPKGILTQGAQAKEKAYKFNATIGIATKGGTPIHLDCLHKHLQDFAPADLYTYAPTTGRMDLRKAWKEKQLHENPSLKDKNTGLPIVTNALTHGLSIVADLFCNDGDYVVMPDKFWGNYRLTFNTRRGGLVSTFPIFNEAGGFNVEGMLAKVEECGKLRPKVILVLNFPNNPTGYTPTPAEAFRIVKGLKALADNGTQIVAIIDDAYFGMFYEDSIKESLFGMLTHLSPNLLPIKLDGATKEIFVWGFRVGFITFGSTTANDESKALEALEKKVAGAIRGTISNVTHPSQTFVAAALKDPDFEAERKANVEILKERALKSKQILSNPKYADQFTVYPFNSGYFLCLRLLHVDSEKLRMHLLDKYGVGAISTSATDLRIAFSCIEVGDLEELFDIVYKGCTDLANA